MLTTFEEADENVGVVIVGLPASTTFPVPVVATSPKVPLSDRMRPLVPLSTVVVPTVILVAERPLRVQLPPRVQVWPFTVVEELVSPEFGIVATVPRTPAAVLVT